MKRKKKNFYDLFDNKFILLVTTWITYEFYRWFILECLERLFR